MSKKKMDKTEFEYDMDYDPELDELEREIGLLLDEYDVEYPSESEMMMTIDAIRPYVPVKESKWKNRFEGMSAIMKQSIIEFFYMSPIFWFSNSLFLLIGLSAVLLSEINPYVILLLLGPIPTITGLLEVIKRMNAGMAELEVTFKYSLQEIILSKMVVVGGFNLIINLFLTFSTSFFYQDVVIWKLMLYWITPFTVITAISFVIVSRFRHVYAVTAGLAVWIVFGSMISQSKLVERIESIPIVVHILVSLIAAIVVIIQLNRIYKRGVNYELNH
ncbi:hypothetical protein [Alkalihalobacillus deserti]|uniref:hypothetical protein n=1 Tax=Alkalihalobacillus deserti TaxID=2879466 RepID=UPI001D13F697|nr:hypothetical protein [Alkalihalobacillus deserti]